MKRIGRRLLLGLACTAPLLASLGVTAQTVYRCGTDGRTYSQAPCVDGRLVDAADPRTAEQRVAGERAAAREKALADNLERHRHADEAARRTATTAASFKAPSAAAPASAPVRHARYYRRKIAR